MCVESGGQNCWLWLFTLQIGWKMGWQGVVRRAKIVALHREAPQHPVGCPFAEEVVEHCRAEATRLTKPPCPSGERFPFSHSNGRPQCFWAPRSRCWPELSQEPLVQVRIHLAATRADRLFSHPNAFLLPHRTLKVFRSLSHGNSHGFWGQLHPLP